VSSVAKRFHRWSFIYGFQQYNWLDGALVSMGSRCTRRSRNICPIPGEGQRLGGTDSYAEWSHFIGVFQTLFCLHLDPETDNRFLDVACGTGLLGIASEPL
jgi:hypothetical protein